MMQKENATENHRHPIEINIKKKHKYVLRVWKVAVLQASE